ncbi:MAG: hydantoinase/oxoprolinase family protein [Deltaproteobacteria bacterium]|nr:hydantoinase/oxoprolinase family protein [Deltaproteobacteria bacterium]
MNRVRRSQLVIGVDTGGTFTDIVYRDGAMQGRLKLLSTPDDPARAVLEGLARLFADRRPDQLTYGTTVATNAMLQRRGARTVLVTTAGFEDVLEIGRQARPDLYALEPTRPEPLVPPSRRLGVTERILFDGSVETGLGDEECRRVRRAVEDAGAEAIAVCLLHSTVNACHELRLARALEDLGVPITLSHALWPLPGEYERCSTAVANAFVQPRVASHIRSLAERSGVRRLRVMQSNGGAIGAQTAGREPVRTMLSGPAGGVAGAIEVAARVGLRRIVTLDMGGTSTDVAFVDGQAPRRSVTEIGGLPLAVPCIDIHTVGAGGGSIASVDAGGALRVGPDSAGADPGPACYGRGNKPTVTDANAALGRLQPRHFLGGDMILDVERARVVLKKLARVIAAASVEAAAIGVVRVVEGNMERAIRTITVQRGEDPRSCVLVAFGGAAGLHACGLADQLGFPEVLIPADPGLLSARGVLGGRVIIDRIESLRAVDPDYDFLARRARCPALALRREIAREGIAERRIRISTLLRARYLGQSLELEVPLTRGWRRHFDALHQKRYHSHAARRSVEVVGLRFSGCGEDAGPTNPRTLPLGRGRPVVEDRVAAFVGGRRETVPVYRRDRVGSGARLRGPAIIAEYSSTTWVEAGFEAVVDEVGNLRLRRAPGNGRRR